MNDTIIGLDFGNHSSMLCFIEDVDSETKTGGNVHELLSPQHNGGIPSVYFYSQQRGMLCGYDAVSQRALPFQNRLRNLKRRLGETVVLDDKTVSVDEAITEVIQYCVRFANKQLLENFRKTTNLIALSYPVYYTFEQKQKLIGLAEKATLEDGTQVKVCGTIAEPAAAALDYLAMHGKFDKEATVMVYDLGGDAFKISLVGAYPKGRRNAFGDIYYYDILCYRRLRDVSGNVFDDEMTALLNEKISVELEGETLTAREADAVRKTAENAKIELSVMSAVNPEIVHEDDVLDIEVTREEFEDKIQSILKKTIRVTKNILRDHPDNKPDYIVLTGGSCEMPMVEAGLKKYLKEYADLIVKGRPALAVAAGAARYSVCEFGQTNGVLIENAAKPKSEKEKTSKTSNAKIEENRGTKPSVTSEDGKAKKPTPPKKSPKELYDEGEKYYYGRGVTTDYAKAMEYYRESAELGYADAQFTAGYCYAEGKGVTKSYEKAAEWYSKAAMQGHAGAQSNLGYCYDCGQGVAKDASKAVEWYRKAALQGQAKAQYNLGYCYYTGKGVTKSFAQAAQWFRKSADQKNPGAQYYLGCCYEQGQSVEKDVKKAAEWYCKAAELGHAGAQYKAAYCYEQGQGIKRDYGKAFQWYQKSANQSNAEAQYRLAYCYARGIGVAINAGQAAEWYQKSANQGHADAQYKLAYCYEHGNGVMQDHTKAVGWYRKAAVQGHADAQCNLGFCYSQGRGVSQNLVTAVEWYRKAANQGNAQAQHNLGYCYDQGRGVTKDYVQSAEWFRKAAIQGNSGAQYSLGLCYEQGDGVVTNEAEAIHWYKKASKQGNKNAKKNIRELKRKDGVFRLYALISAILMLFVCNGGALWEKLWSITPLGLGKATGISGFGYSMITFTVLTLLIYFVGLLFVYTVFDNERTVRSLLAKFALLLSVGMWYAGYGLSHLLVKITWGYYVFAMLLALIAGALMAIAMVFILFQLDINTGIYIFPNIKNLFDERCRKLDGRFIASMVFFHVGFCGFHALKNGMNVEDTWGNKIILGLLLIGGGMFSVFYAIKRIVAACAKYADRSDRKRKRTSEIVLFILTAVLTVAFFTANYVWNVFAENETLRMLTAPCTFTLPFVLFFRFIAIVAMNKKLKK